MEFIKDGYNLHGKRRAVFLVQRPNGLALDMKGFLSRTQTAREKVITWMLLRHRNLEMK